MKKLLVTCLSLSLFAASAGMAYAQTQFVTPSNGINPNTFCSGGSCTYVPLEPLPGLPTSYGPNKGSGSFPELISSSFRLLIGAGGLIAVVMIVLGALTYMFSDIAGNKKNALNRIRNAMWAIVLLVSSYLILYTINPELVQFNLNLGNPNNYATTPNSSGTATPAPSDTTQTQPVQETFNQQRLDLCVASGGTLTPTANNGYVCISP